MIQLNFIAPPAAKDFCQAHDVASMDQQPSLFVNSTWAWVVQTVLVLREAGLDVTVAASACPDSINFSLANQLRELERSTNFFMVSMDADQLRARWANVALVQNMTQAGRRAFWIPHWPQPGLIPRDPARTSFERVGFFGLERNLYRGKDWWDQLCARCGMEFNLQPRECWHDYHDVDIALGIRDLQGRRHDEKPPTKLFNAWLAGCAFIAGNDSAYSQVGLRGRDFLYAKSEREVMACLESLSGSPSKGQELVSQGRSRLQAIGSRENTRDRWIQLLERELVPLYQRWRAQKPWRRDFALTSGLAADSLIRTRNSIWRHVKKRLRTRGH